jgi:predicted alpha/beta hydrolase
MGRGGVVECRAALAATRLSKLEARKATFEGLVDAVRRERRIGHFGFFRERLAATLWQEGLLPVLR